MADEMSVEEACRSVLGVKLADAITESQGPHWAFVAAVSSARTDDDPRALAAIDKELKRQKAERLAATPAEQEGMQR